MQKRNYGIDLLRIVLMYMVCVIHTLNQGGILASYEVGTREYNVFLLLRIVVTGAVNAFALISGYMAVNKPQKYEKIVNMWFQAFFYSFVVTLILTGLKVNESLTREDLLQYAMPVTFRKFWYFTAFFALFFMMPALNKIVFHIDKVLAKKYIIVVFVLFTFDGLIFDAFHAEYGYSALWIMIMYCLGALAKRINMFNRLSSLALILMWIFCILLTWRITIAIEAENLIKYTSPTILLSSLILVILFSRIKLKGRVISKITPFVFGIYLFQLNGIIYRVVLKNAFVFVAKKELGIAVLYTLLLAGMIFVIGLIVEIIRQILMRILQIPRLSKLIVRACSRIVELILPLMD